MANEKLQNAQKIIPWMYVIISIKFLQVNSHGRLIEPPSRASMWRKMIDTGNISAEDADHKIAMACASLNYQLSAETYSEDLSKKINWKDGDAIADALMEWGIHIGYGFNTPADYNDHELYCGGFTRQYQTNGGKCGICGDSWDAPQPRPHEAGGKYGQGIIVRRYKKGSHFTIRVEVTANHRGFFEFKLCPNNMPKRVATQKCLDKYVLRRAKLMSKESDENFHETRYYPGIENKVYEMKYVLPAGLTCSQCVLQWRYVAGNNWGMCSNGTGAVGCGPQEEFRACADILIFDPEDGSSNDNPYEETTTQKGKETTPKKKEEEEEEEETTTSINDIPNETLDKLHPEATQAKTREYIILLVSIMGCTLLAIVLLFVLLYFYYYHANELLQSWWSKGGSGLRDATCWSRIKTGIRSCSKRGQEKTDQKLGADVQYKPPVPPVPPLRTKKNSIGFQGVPENLV